MRKKKHMQDDDGWQRLTARRRGTENGVRKKNQEGVKKKEWHGCVERSKWVWKGKE